MKKERLSPARTLGFLERLRPRIAPYKGRIAAAALLILVSSAIGLVFPLMVRDLLDAAFLAGSATMLNRVALGLLALFGLQAVVNFAQSYLTASVSERVVADLRKDVFGALVAQPPGFFAVRRVGELTSRLASDAGLVQQVLRFGVPELVRQGSFLVGALVLVTMTNPSLTLVTLTAIPFAIVVGWLFGRRVRRISTDIQDTLASAVARAEQVFTQIRTVQSFTREGWESDGFGAEVDATRDQGLDRAVARAALTGAITFAAFGAIVVVLWQGGRLVLQGELTAGMLVAFLLYAVSIAGAITSLAGFWNNMQEAAGAARRIFEILDHAPELPEAADPVALPRPLEGRVSFDEVRFRYGPDEPVVLDGIDLELAPGETVALVGSSGAGKSTLASLVPRFYDVTEGRVAVDGVDVRKTRLSDLRGRIGVVPQEPMLFAGTVRDNLLYGNPEATEEEIRQAAGDAHAAEFVERLTEGYDQLIGERGVTLSAGQRQRIAIARVFLKRPRILILDEASSSLDAESERLVQEALERLMEGRTTLVIAHRLSTVIHADRIVVLDAGVIEDVGSHGELLARSPVYSRLYRRQFEAALASVDGGESA
ncbi:MAG TPA: ABC transporter transmembrane domain-containing protein [Longimicrobiales bacterium]|nr:ABC transporter transmembrane domain-containing protein [Longimicrobiales bacterium]